MTQTLTLRHERIDDIPLIIGLANQLRLAEILDAHLGTHGVQQGLNNGQLAVGWWADILSQGDHRQSAVREWAHARAYMLSQLLGQRLREVDFGDDRWGGVLQRLSNDEAWEALAEDLWAATVAVYELELTGIRLESTTSDGYHQVTEAGVMPFGPSQDHRPDLPPLQLMAAAAEPAGQLIACDVAPGQCADDPLYTPLIQRVRDIVGRTGVLYAGDWKLAALSTRAELVAHGDDSVTPLPLTGETAAQFEGWVSAIVDGPQAATLVWDGARLLGAGYEFARPLSATGDGRPVPWSERVQVVRAVELARRQQATLEKHLVAAAEEWRTWPPPPGRGKRQIREEGALHAAIASVLARHGVTGRLTVVWERHETPVTRYVGRGRGGPDRPIRTAVQVRDVMTGVQRHEAALAAQRHRLGWRVQVSHAPIDRLPRPAAVRHDRQGWSLARDFHRVKDLPVGLSPLLVWKDDQITGLTRLLTLARRLLTLRETRVRRALEEVREAVASLYEGQPTRTTDRPTGKRLWQALARAEIT